MISDDERRAVAARMREIMRDDPHGWLDVMVGKAVVGVMGDGEKIGETVADLIDRPVYRPVIPNAMEGNVFCPQCGAEIGEYGVPNYCHSCGVAIRNGC